MTSTYAAADNAATVTPVADPSPAIGAGADTFAALGIPPTVSLFLGQQIRDGLSRVGLIQRELAETLGLDPAIVSLWMVDRRPVPHNRMDALAAALETTPRELVRRARMGRYAKPVRPEPVGLRALSDDPRDHVLLEFVVEPQPEPVRPPDTPPPSARGEKAWCNHGGRLHHHGPAPVWAPRVERIDQ